MKQVFAKREWKKIGRILIGVTYRGHFRSNSDISGIILLVSGHFWIGMGAGSTRDGMRTEWEDSRHKCAR